jgi:hypothetical protein
MTLIETKTLGADAASIEFTSIPQDGTDLLLLISGRTARTNFVVDAVNLTMNGGGTITARTLLGNPAAGASSNSDPFLSAFVSTDITTANTFGNGAYYIPNYTGTQNKSVSIDSVQENNGTEVFLVITAGLIANSAAISTLTLTSVAANLVAGSTASLYKVTKGSDGIVTTS